MGCMAFEAPSPRPASPEPELAQLRQKVEKLERELRSCKRQVQEVEKLLQHTELLYRSAESNNQELHTQESASVLAAVGPALEGYSLVESLRAVAEAAVSQTGFTYDENTGLYFDHSTGFYYDSENQLYYDPSTGIYYYCDVESGRYQFHSRADLQPYQTVSTKPSRDKKLEKRRKEPGSCTANDERDLSSEDQKVCSVDYLNCTVKPATIRREKDKEHTLRIPEVGVSKFHAEIYFDHDLQSYVIVDQGSQNGTVVNGKQILQPKTESDP
ncbi:Angiogenic factor with G patch and FHA domains 1 [Lemmus lemmus]